MDSALHLICVIEGVAVPILEYAGGWGIGQDDRFNIVLPGAPAFENIKPSTHVHIFLAEGGSYSWRRRASFVPRDKITDNLMWFEESIRTMVDLKEDKLIFPEDAWENYSLKDGVDYSCLKYRGGGEVSSCIKVVGASSSPTYVLSVEGYSSVLGKLQAIQLLGRRGGLSDVEIRMMGQHTPVYPGKGRNKFNEGVIKDLTDKGKDLLHLNYFLIRKFSAKINKMWRKRIPWSRMPNQIIGIDEDKAAKFVVEGPDFKRLLKEVLQSQQILPLKSLNELLLQFINYQVVPVPTPAFFPLIPSNEKGKKMVEVLRPATRGGMGVRVHFPIYKSQVLPPSVPGLPSNYAGWILRYGKFDFTNKVLKLTKPTSISFLRPFDQTITDYINAHGDTIPLVEGTLKGGPVRGSARWTKDKKIIVTWTIRDGYHGGPANYTQTLDLGVTGMEEDRLEVTNGLLADLGYLQEAPQHYGPGQLLPDALRGLDMDGEVIYERRIPNASSHTTPNERGNPEIGFGFEFFPTPPRPAYTEMVEEVGDDIIPDEYDNAASRLNTYAYLPKLWWAQFPVSNIVLPSQIIGTVQISKISSSEITRSIAKVPMGRSGHRQTYANTFPAPTPSDLNESIPEDKSATEPDNLHFSEYAQGVQADILFLETLFRAVKEDKWKEYIKSFVTTTFWDKRLAGRAATFSMSFDPNIVTGAPLLLMTMRPGVSGELAPSQMTPEQKHLLARLSYLHALKKALRKCIKGVPGDDLLRHLICCYNIRTVFATVTNPPSSFSYEGKTGLGVSQGVMDVCTAWKKANNSTKNDDFFSALRCKTYGGKYVYTTTGGPWTVNSALRALGVKESVEAGIPSEVFAKMFTGQNAVFMTNANINRLINYLNSSERADRISSVQRCNAAIRRDIARIEAAIKETNDLLKKYRGSVATIDAYIGYVMSVQDSWSADSHSASMSVTLSHVRKVGEDLDWDTIAGDDVENVVSFGEKSLHDERYEREKIGKAVYKPIFGTVTPLEVPDLRSHLFALRERNAEDADSVDSLPPIDASDIEATFEHPAICGHNCKEHLEKDETNNGITEYEVANAVVDWYIESVSKLGEDVTSDIFRRWKTRAVMNFAEAYSGFPVVWGSDEVDYGVRSDLADYMKETYVDLPAPIAGFFSTSFVGAFDNNSLFDRITPKKESDIDKEAPTLSDEERKLLTERGSLPLEGLRQLEDKTYR